MEFTSTYSWACSAENKKLVDFVRASRDLPLLSVGSGGSRTAAFFAALLHQVTGMLSQDLTPLEFVLSTYKLRQTSMILFTARGRNSDILTALKTAINREPRELMVVCASNRSPMAKIARRYRSVRLAELEPPSGRDGFLATNSLLTFVVSLTRAYRDSFQIPYRLPLSLTSLLNSESSTTEFYDDLERKMHLLVDKSTLVVLYGKWGRPAALDLESRLIEAALCNVQLADFRNFAHGRHNWLSKKSRNTGVIGLVTPEDKDLADRTLDLIPQDIPIARILSSRSEPLASVSLIVQAMYLAEILGKSRHVDPGRPHIPKFGRQIYHLRIPAKMQAYKQPFSNDLSQSAVVAISRKTRNSFMDKEGVAFWSKAYHQFFQNLTQTRFNAIVFDYDGTLCDSAQRFVGASTEVGEELSKLLEYGIYIGIATGRGKSLRYDLQRLIPNKHWSRVLVGYYNGSDIAPLEDDTHPDKKLAMDSSLRSFQGILENLEYIDQIATYECRPRQITFSPNSDSSSDEVISFLHDLVAKTSLSGIQVLRSTHTIDLLAPGVSKLELVKAIETRDKETNEPIAVLCIADKGEWPGNDFFLLGGPYSLSVDTVSPDPASCWNLAPAGYRGVHATMHYLEALETRHERTKFNPSKLGRVKN